LTNHTILHYHTSHNAHHTTKPHHAIPYHTTHHHNITYPNTADTPQHTPHTTPLNTTHCNRTPHHIRPTATVTTPHTSLHTTPHTTLQHPHNHSTQPNTLTHLPHSTHRNTPLRTLTALRILVRSPLRLGCWVLPGLSRPCGGPRFPPSGRATPTTTQHNSRSLETHPLFCFFSLHCLTRFWGYLVSPSTSHTNNGPLYLPCRRSHIPLVALSHRTHGPTLPIIGDVFLYSCSLSLFV
jgi:hypothetical protein